MQSLLLFPWLAWANERRRVLIMLHTNIIWNYYRSKGLYYTQRWYPWFKKNLARGRRRAVTIWFFSLDSKNDLGNYIQQHGILQCSSSKIVDIPFHISGWVSIMRKWWWRENLFICPVNITFNSCTNPIPPKVISGAFISFCRWMLFGKLWNSLLYFLKSQ